MIVKWNFFIAAAFFSGWALISNGVPLAPVMAGIGAAGALNYWRSRQSRT